EDHPSLAAGRARRAHRISGDAGRRRGAPWIALQRRYDGFACCLTKRRARRRADGPYQVRETGEAEQPSRRTVDRIALISPRHLARECHPSVLHGDVHLARGDAELLRSEEHTSELQ